MTMFKNTYQGALTLTVCVLFATTIIAAPTFGRKSTSKRGSKSADSNWRTHLSDDSNKEKLTLEVTGADSTQAEAINKVLTDNGLKSKLHVGKGKTKPIHLALEIDRGLNLNLIPKAISAARITPIGQAAPSLKLVLYAPFSQDSSTRALAELEKLKGVDAKNSTTDIERGELHVLTGEEAVTADDISDAVRAAGVTARFKTQSKNK